ncbi:UDP-glucose 6-dehydrogenase TuaD [compost metagenome]
MVQKIGVIGTGYVGLVSGACFADMGNQVICVDRDTTKINRLLQADIPIYEPGLEELVRRNLKLNRLAFTSHIAEAVSASDLIFIAVGTPTLENGEVDMTQVRSAIIEITRHIHSPKIIVMKSTVPVGTGKSVENWIREELTVDAQVHVVSNPEFLREGTAIHDTFHPDRVVIGAADEAAGQRIAELHAPLQAEILLTDRESAELIKYASNAFLAAKISFINEMAHVCEKVGADVGLVAKGMGLDRRIGPHFLQAGIGYGGSCFPKDTRAQLKIAEKVDYDFQILRAVIDANQLQRQRFVDKIRLNLNGDVRGKRIAVLGLAFKPNTDDLRDAPALDIIAALQQEGAVISAYDPIATGAAAELLSDVKLHTDLYDAIQDTDAMVITTEWDEIKQMDLYKARISMNQPVLIDGRNIFDPKLMREIGFHYVSIGRM